MRVTVTHSQATVYCKTEAGLEEMQKRQAGLNSRVRQLLILIDGKRSNAELQRLMAVAELEEFLALLELKGLIAHAQVHATEIREPDHHVAEVFPGHASRGPATLRDARADEQDAGPQVVEMPLPPGPAIVVADRVEVNRQNLARTLAEAVGPMADHMCQRISVAQAEPELLELFQAAMTVVELMSGRKAADRFVEKMKSLGWEY